MADNITLNTGSGGDTIAADDISGVKYQRVVPVFGLDGSAKTDTSSFNPLPVVAAASDTLLTTISSTLTTTSAKLPPYGSTLQTNSTGPLQKVVSAASTNATLAIGSPAKLMGFMASNVNAAVRYLKIYNLAVAPTVGTSVPAMTILLPVNGISMQNWPQGITFSAGISWALTTEATDAGTTGVSASEHVVHIIYST